MASNEPTGIHGKQLNGFKPRSWGDLTALATLLALFIGVLAWGLKLESELNETRSNHSQRIANLEARVSNGILPRAEERIERNRESIVENKRRLIKLEDVEHEHRGSE